MLAHDIQVVSKCSIFDRMVPAVWFRVVLSVLYKKKKKSLSWYILWDSEWEVVTFLL